MRQLFLSILLLLIATRTVAQTTAPATRPAHDAILLRIRDEGMNHSQTMATLSYLSDVIGPRLTGSPNLKRANEWTRDKLSSWGLTNAQLEPWGPFGRGWSLQRFSAQVIEPQSIPLIAFPKAWSPGFDQPLIAPVVHLENTSEADLAKVRGKLKGAIVLAGPVRVIEARFEPLAVRVTEQNLLKLANSDDGTSSPPGQARAISAAERRAQLATAGMGRLINPNPPGSRPSTAPATRPVTPGRLTGFLAAEGAALIVSPSLQGDGGTLYVANATVPEPATRPASRPNSIPAPLSAWDIKAPPIPPQIIVAAEQYNRLVRIIQQGEKLTMAVELQARYHTDDLMAYNTLAEIAGGDLKDEIVMLGAHMDSWHSGTGATDNGAGVAVVMEAVRILRMIDLHPRRTIRIALWTGEEQGLYGSKAYVTKHFGSYPDAAPTQPGRGPATRPATRPVRTLTRQPEYEQLSVYFNLDNGSGKIRGVYLQGDEAARPLFRKWLSPFSEDDATTLTLSNTSGTDHVSFDAIGLPAFQFIQDPIEYWTRTHHSNADTFDRAQADDLKQAATIMATFVYEAAMAEERVPRKSLER